MLISSLEGEPEDPHHVFDEVYYSIDLFLSLIGPQENVGIVLGELPHPEQAVKDPRFLVPVYRAELEVTQGQVPVAPDLRLIYHDVGQTVHRLEAVLHLIHLRQVHVFPVVLEVARPFPHIELEDLRPLGEEIAPPEVLLLLEILEDVAEESAVRVIDDEARSHFVGNAEKVQLFAKAPVVPLLHLLEELEVLPEGVDARKGRAVYPRKHLVLLVPPPVGAGEGEELECRYHASGRQVRPAAKIGKPVLGVEAHRLVCDAADELDFERFALFLEEVDRLFPLKLAFG